MINPRVVLEALIRRLQIQVGTGEHIRMAWWGDHQPPELVQAGGSGLGRLDYALRYAKEAIASGDSRRITQAAQLCPMWERDGLKQKREHEQASRRRNGGRMRGSRQTEEAAKEWKPWVHRFRELTESGKSPATARSICKREMTAASFTLTATDEFPSDRSIFNRLK